MRIIKQGFDPRAWSERTECTSCGAELEWFPWITRGLDFHVLSIIGNQYTITCPCCKTITWVSPGETGKKAIKLIRLYPHG